MPVDKKPREVVNVRDYIAFRFGCALVAWSVGTAVIFAIFVVYTVSGISREVSFRNHYGADWQAHFEQQFGPVEKARQKTIATGIGAVALPSLVFWIYRLLRKNPHSGGGRKKSRERHMSNTERVMRARSKALFWNYLGILGIVVGVLLVLFRWGIFAEHIYESILGIFVFITGYCCVIGGCWWWLQAKNWSEGVVFIGVAPLAVTCFIVLFIPFVRLIFLAAPLLLPTSMLMATAILLVVVAVLPDKSGVNRKQRRPMNWKDIGKDEQR
jgi:hypothetical protein